MYRLGILGPISGVCQRSNRRDELGNLATGVSIEAARRMSYETADNLLKALQGTVNPETLANPEILE